MLTGEWRKSTRSGGNGACVEARYTGHTTEVRDSKDITGPVLAFTPAAWRTFVRHIR
ncbi:DUF397 domain-containing protein [Plantactinospora sp. DSM 117369]